MKDEAPELEQQVLGYCLLNVSVDEKLQLTPEMFAIPAHKTIYDAILKCDLNGGCDLGTVTQYLRDKGKLEEAGGPVYITQLTAFISPTGQLFKHAMIIHQIFIRRQAGKTLQQAKKRCESRDDIADIIGDVTKALSDLIPNYHDERQLRVDLTAEPLPAPALLYFKNNDKLIPSFTLQNFSLITGKAKSRKTFLSVLIVASYLGYINDIIQADPERKGTVIIFDTEQSPYHLYKMTKRICSMIGEENPGRLQAYGLKTLTPEEKVNFIEHKIKTTPGLRFIIIDGVRDLIYDINSPEEATKTSVLLMKWCAMYDIHILNVLHQNKSDGNARGHLGSEMTNKAETTLTVNLDGTISTVECEYSRELEFSPFSFEINDNSLPEICNTPEVDKPIKRSEPNLMSNEKHYKVLERVFKNYVEKKYKEACIDIKLEYAEEGIYFGENKARDYLAYYIKEGWVSKNEMNKSYKYERSIF